MSDIVGDDEGWDQVQRILDPHGLVERDPIAILSRKIALGETESQQPTASVDAEPVAWLYDLDGSRRVYETRFPMQIPGCPETPLYTEAQMQARADAARREALEEAAKVADGYAAAGKDNPQLAPISAQMRYCAQRIRTLKGSQQ